MNQANPEAKEHIVEIDEVSALKSLEAELGQPVTKIDWLKKGYFSKAGLVETADHQKIMSRFGNDPRGFQKDRYAHQHFNCPDVPIPRVNVIKQLDSGVWLCLSEHIDGVISDELHGQEAQEAIPNVQQTLVVLHSTPIKLLQGYGEFDENGRTSYSSWVNYLTDDFCTPKFYGDRAVDTALIKQAWKTIGELAPLCPTERFLVHEDFGADNLLIKDGKVVAVLDWFSALVGDWAMDVARMQKYPREVYGDLRAAHEKAGFDCSNWGDRINCYRIRAQIGLISWFWDRQVKGLKNWQDLDGAQSNLKSGLERVKAGSVYGSS